MKIRIIEAIRLGFELREMVNKHGCNHILFHKYLNNKSGMKTTFRRDKYFDEDKDLFFEKNKIKEQTKTGEEK